ncbi:MAG: hypothetical protein ACE5HO_10275, partial [bacterium]
MYGYGPGFYSGGGAAPQYSLQMQGYNYNELKRLAEALGKKLTRLPRVREVDTNSTLGFRTRENLFEMVLRVDRAKLLRFHLTAGQVLAALQSYLRGISFEYRGPWKFGDR